MRGISALLRRAALASDKRALLLPKWGPSKRLRSSRSSSRGRLYLDNVDKATRAIGWEGGRARPRPSPGALRAKWTERRGECMAPDKACMLFWTSREPRAVCGESEAQPVTRRMYARKTDHAPRSRSICNSAISPSSERVSVRCSGRREGSRGALGTIRERKPAGSTPRTPSSRFAP